LCIPNNMAKTFPAEGVALKFSPGVAGWCHFTECLFISRSKWWLHVRFTIHL
jgi:hypothetical protein